MSTAAFDPSAPTLHAVYELSAGPYRGDELRVLSFDGHEEMNAPFAFHVIFWAKDAEEAELQRKLLGQPAALAMHVAGGAPRRILGIACDVTLEGKHPGGRHTFRMTLVPRLRLLGHRVNSRIFQDQTVQEIVTAVLDEHGILHSWDLLGKYPSRQYCVQYEESDLQFITRLLAEEGLFFSFEHPDDDGSEPAQERVVIADTSAAYAPIAGDPALVYRHQTGDGAMTAEENQVLDFRVQTRIEPSRVVMRDYDFRRPLLQLTSQAPPVDAPLADVPAVKRELEVYDHHGEYEETDADANNARVYLEQLRAGVRVAHGTSVCRRLAPGHTFDLHDHEIEALDAKWVVTRVEHHGVAPEGGTKKGARIYENRFRCAAADVPIRPPRPRRVVKQVVESAIVVGPEGQEIHTDAFGRVKVQFHWN